MPTSQTDNNLQSSPYIIPAATTTTTAANDAPTLCDIKLICSQRKKKSKYDIYLTFVESCPLSSNEQPCIEILGKPKSPLILLDGCISFECFDTTINDHQSFIYIYFQTETVSIYFSDEHIKKKPVIIKHLEYMYQKKSEKSKDIPIQQPLQDLTTTEHILHTFDIKLIPYETIITRDHSLVGPARLYFTTTDLYIASRDCNRMDLKTTITNQCPSTNNNILCIPYFTIRHYGNRSNTFLIELGKSNYGNGEIHMKCLSASLASTIHLLVSPVIEERPLALSSAFRNQFLAAKRVEKSKALHPPVQLNPDPIARSISLHKKHSIESLPEQSTRKKSRSLFGLFRKLVKNPNSLQRSCTFNDRKNERKFSLQPFANKYFAFNLDEKKFFQERNPINSSESLATNKRISSTSFDQLDTNLGTYIDMGPTVIKPDQIQAEEIKDESIIEEPTTTAEIGVNTTLSLSPLVHSAIIVGSSVHLLAEEQSVFPIGQRSFTSPASVMQPFKAQLNGQTSMTSACIDNPSNSCYQSISPSDPRQSLLLSYGIVTFNNNSLLPNQTNYASDGSILDHRLNSDLSLMSISPQEQPSNLFSCDNILSSSSSSHIFRTLSHSTNNIGDNISGHLRTSNGSIIFFDENFPDQTTTYLLEQPSTTFTDETVQTNLTKSLSRSQSTNNDKDKISSDDSYALVEPLNIQPSSVPSLPMVSIKPLLPSENPIIYTDVFLPTTIDDEQCDYPSPDGDLIEGLAKVFYADIDFYQIQRRNRIAQFAAISKLKDQMPPFVL